MDPIKTRAYVGAHREQMIETVCRLVRVPSLKSAPTAEAPYGEECLRGLKTALSLFEKEGFCARLAPSGRYGVVAYGEGALSDAVGIFAHTDVVPVGEGWKYTADPFSPVVREGGIIGRGAEDNKAGVNMALWTLCYLRDHGITPSRPIVVFLGAEEESGMTDIETFVREEGMPFVSIVPDGGYPVCVGEKGIARAVATASAPFAEVLSASGGEAFNVILDRATVCLRDSDALYAALSAATASRTDMTLARENGVLSLTARGIAKHASTPEGSVNAAYLAFSLLGECAALCEHDRAILQRAAYLLSVTDGSCVGIAASDEFFGGLTMANGMVYLTDGRLSVSFDIRYGVTVKGDEMQTKVDNSLEKMGFSCHWLENSDGFACPRDGREVEAILSAAEAYSGSRPAPFYMGGGTYARHLKNAYSTATFVPYVPDPAPQETGRGGAHQADERLPIDAHLEATALFIDTVLALCAL